MTGTGFRSNWTGKPEPDPASFKVPVGKKNLVGEEGRGGGERGAREAGGGARR